LLEEQGVPFRYREYTTNPLSQWEIRQVLRKLGLRARDIFRRRDFVNRELRLTGLEAEDELIRQMAEHPTLIQRPIGVRGDRAVVGRPPENLLKLVKG